MPRAAGKGTHYTLEVIDRDTGLGTGVKRDLPSVTTILDTLSKPALLGWYYSETVEGVAQLLKKYPGKVPDDPKSIKQLLNKDKLSPFNKRDTAASRGTDIHSVFEQLVLGKLPTLTTPIENELSRWVMARKGSFIEAERCVVNLKLGYAGTCDVVFYDHGGKGHPKAARVIADLKTSAKVYDSYWMQNAAYRLAWNEENPSEPVERVGIILAPRDSSHVTFHEIEGEELEKVTEQWLAVLELYKKLA